MVVRWAEKRGWVVEFDSGKLHKMMDQKILNCAHGSILSTTYNVANKVLKENKKHDEGSWRFGSTITLEALPFRLPRSEDFKRHLNPLHERKRGYLREGHTLELRRRNEIVEEVTQTKEPESILSNAKSQQSVTLHRREQNL